MGNATESAPCVAAPAGAWQGDVRSGRERMISALSLAAALLATSAAAQPAPQSVGVYARPAVPTLADPITGLDLWRGAKVGMDVTAVRRAFPAAVPPATPTILTGGEIDRLQLSAVDLDGRRAVAHFFFKEGGLVSVELTLPGLKPGESAANARDMARLAEHLTGTYGDAYDCGDRSESDITAYGCKWLRKPLSIRLWYMDVAGQAPLFYLAFRQADDPGYDL